MLEHQSVDGDLCEEESAHRGWTWSEKHWMKSNRQKIENIR